MTNDQGGSDSLTYNGVLPSNYKAKINTTSDFGKVTFSSESGSLTFGLDSNSNISKNNYSSVLQAISASNISNENTWITFNSTYKYRIVQNVSNWDLEVANNRTGYTSRITKPFLKDTTAGNSILQMNEQVYKSGKELTGARRNMVRQKLNNMISSGGRDTLLSLASDDFVIEGGLGLQDPSLFEKENEALLKQAVLDGYMSVLEDSAAQGAIDNRPKVSGNRGPGGRKHYKKKYQWLMMPLNLRE